MSPPEADECLSCQNMLSHQQLRQILPQDYPFLMIDRVVDFKKGESLTAIKNITGNEWVFAGQSYPSNIFPETLIIEAAAQAAIAFYRLNEAENGPKSKIFLGRTKAEFFHPVHIGDQIRLKTLSARMLKASGYMDVNVSVEETNVADIEIMYSVVR